MDRLRQILIGGDFSCVIGKGDEVRIYHQRGVIDLFELIEKEPQFLHGAKIADKVVGKGAAALMVLGGVVEVHAAVISRPALDLLQRHGIEVSYLTLTDRIENRRKDGLCPVETRCLDLDSPREMYIKIKDFINTSK